MAYPDQYLCVTNEREGAQSIMPIDENEPLDLAALVDRWIETEFAGECIRDGAIAEGSLGAATSSYEARIITDGRSPDSCVVWSMCGFEVKSPE